LPTMNAEPRQTLLRKPPWLKVPPPYAGQSHGVRKTLAGLKLHTVCREAACPNIAECFASGTATFLILGNICTRNCRYCNIAHGLPTTADQTEPARLAAAVAEMNIRYVVITSVTRDDLADGGAKVFSDCIRTLRESRPSCKIEVLIPDFGGNPEALQTVIEAGPDVINHNIEVAASLYPQLRPQGDYRRSLDLLKSISQTSRVSKSGFMVGFGETRDDLTRLMDDLASVSCERLTIGQYQQPSRRHWPVKKYYPPEEFTELKSIALAMGFRHVEAGPRVRSSYHAAKAEND